MPNINDFMGKSECMAVNEFPPMGPGEVKDVPRIDRFKYYISTMLIPDMKFICNVTSVVKVTVAGMLMSETGIGQSMNVQIKS